MTITLSQQELKDLLLTHEKAMQAWTTEFIKVSLDWIKEPQGSLESAAIMLEKIKRNRPIFTLL
jgi:hypothetical protein